MEEKKVLLSNVLDRVLSTGVTITGDLTIGIADVDLIYCGLRVLLTSVDKLIIAEPVEPNTEIPVIGDVFGQRA
ncbi:MAG: gas vesicle protein [Bacteroidota bacterium]